MAEAQDISEKIDEVCRRPIRSVKELKNILADLEHWASHRLAINKSTRLTAETHDAYIGPTQYTQRKLEP